MSSAHSHAEHNPYLAHHFKSMEQQVSAATLGMWLFLAQEFMFFGGMFVAYAVYRYSYTPAWSAGSHMLAVGPGAINTIILLLSSFSMAMGVYYCQTDQKKKQIGALIMTLLLGIAFVVIKLIWEWAPKFDGCVFPGASFGHYAGAAYPSFGGHYAHLNEFPQPNHLHLFFIFYFVMTGMHAFHMLIGFGLILWLIYGTMRGKHNSQNYITIENFGLYWHFVDIVWVFLFPMFYLVH